MPSGASTFVCAGCGMRAPDRGMPPFRCPNAKQGDDVDHVIERQLDTARVEFPTLADKNPFVAFRGLLGAHHRALAAGIEDRAFVERVEALDRRIAEVDGHGFFRTSYEEQPALAAAVGFPGRLRVKNETRNVSGSHKSRHLMGLLLYLEMVAEPSELGRPLAISSCGNAALAAAVLARAAARPLTVFVPSWANAAVVDRLRDLGATLVVCERDPDVAGDPCTLAFRRAVAGGAIPFSCQGSDNGLMVEGGMTLVYEMIARRPDAPDRLFVQVGGGALASACIAAWEEAVRWGLTPKLPALHPVQTEAVAPLARAWSLVTRQLLPDLGWAGELPEPGGALALEQASEWARFVFERQRAPAVHEALRYAATNRSRFMWPWEGSPRGLASGILDDETYDWLAVVRGMLRSGGFPIVVSDETIDQANRLARAHTIIPVDHTGSAGLAGLVELTRAGLIPNGSEASVLFTGRDRTIRA